MPDEPKPEPYVFRVPQNQPAAVIAMLKEQAAAIAASGGLGCINEGDARDALQEVWGQIQDAEHQEHAWLSQPRPAAILAGRDCGHAAPTHRCLQCGSGWCPACVPNPLVREGGMAESRSRCRRCSAPLFGVDETLGPERLNPANVNALGGPADLATEPENPEGAAEAKMQ